MLWQLFITFFKLGLVSFGGGYAMIPLIDNEAVSHGWVHDTTQFTDIIAIAGMSPGPIATNCAVIIGYQQAGILGAAVAVIASALPSMLVLGLLLTVLGGVRKHPLFHSAFYGVRPIVVSLIAYAGVRFAISNHLVEWNWHAATAVVICLACLVGLIRYRLHPITVILASGLVGAAIYG